MPRRRDPITQLETAIECLPRPTREAMLEGIRTRPIIAGAYTDNRGGICPMLAAHRGGARTNLLSFARSWDAFARAKRVRRATRRELRVLEDLLLASLAHDVDLGAAIAAHRQSAAGHARADELGAILDGGFDGPLTVARLSGRSEDLSRPLEDDLGNDAVRRRAQHEADGLGDVLGPDHLLL
jgi:hypothetical protein